MRKVVANTTPLNQQLIDNGLYVDEQTKQMVLKHAGE